MEDSTRTNRRHWLIGVDALMPFGRLYEVGHETTINHLKHLLAHAVI